MAKKFRIIGLTNNSDFLRVELKKEKGMLEALNKVLKAFGIDYIEFTMHEHKRKINYDTVYKLIPEYLFFDNCVNCMCPPYNFSDDETVDIHLLKFSKSIMLISYFKKNLREKILNEIEKYFVFAKPKMKKK